MTFNASLFLLFMGWSALTLGCAVWFSKQTN